MRVLFDQGTPVPLRRHLPDHRVETAYERGWSDLRNSALLDRAEAEGFEVPVWEPIHADPAAVLLRSFDRFTGRCQYRT